MQKNILNLSIFLMFIFNSCLPPTATNVIVGINYENKTNTTDYMVFPYGKVSLPGHWDKEWYNNISHQQWFTNSDSISVAIALNRSDGYEFYSEGLSGFSYVRKFYEWDSKYLKTKFNVNDTVLVTDTINNYIIWSLNISDFKNYFLFGLKNATVHNYNIVTNKLSEKEKIKFLQDLYFDKK